eukprot:316866_1
MRMSLVINILICLLILNNMECKEEKQNAISTDLIQYVSNPLQYIPIVTIKPKIFEDNPPCPIIQFVGKPIIEKNLTKLNSINWTQYEFDDCIRNVDFCTFKKLPSKIVVYDWIYDCILNKTLVDDHEFKTTNVTKLIQSIQSDQIYFIKWRTNGKFNILDKYIYLTMCESPIIANYSYKTEKKGTKINCNI